MTFPPWASAERSRTTHCAIATGVFVLLYISFDHRRTSWFIRNKAWGGEDECINQILCCAGSDRKHGAQWMHDWLLALPWCLSVFLCILWRGCPSVGTVTSHFYMYGAPLRRPYTNKHRYDVIIIVMRIRKVVHSKVLEEKEKSNSV